MGLLRAELSRIGDPRSARSMQTYMKSEVPFHGVRAADVRRISRDVFSDAQFRTAAEWKSTIWRLWDLSRYREERYAIIALARAKVSLPFQTPAVLAIYRRMIETGAWWDYVDEIAIHSVGPIVRRYRQDAAPIVLEWSRGPDLWVRRAAILCQVGSKEETDLKLLEGCLLPSIPSREFFLRKAIGWALRQTAKFNSAWVRRFVSMHEETLSPLSKREALRNL